MRFLVATSTALLLINDKKEIKNLAKGFFYGITFDKDFIYAFKRNAPATVFVFDSNIKQIDQKVLPLSHLHQAHYDPVLDKILVTDTGNNSLALLDRGTFKKTTKKWTQARQDHNHINSIYRYNGDLYIYEHDLSGLNRPLGHGGVRRLTKDFKSDKIWRIADKGHNIYIKDDVLYVLDTFNRKFICRPLDNRYEAPCTKLLSTEEYGEFGIRGLAIGDTRIITGLSMRLSRHKRATRHTGYVVWFDSQYKKLDDLFLVHGQVLEIRLLDEIDYAHNGLIFP
ncbi:MAG: hypothetical protein ACXADW_02930 [Candidatus Hodarchaeales archaeon]|jgi:hypothetical protein